MSEDYEYETEVLVGFYHYFLVLMGMAFEQKDSKLVEVLEMVNPLLPSRLPPNMNMRDLVLSSMPPSMKERFEARMKVDGIVWSNANLVRRGPSEEVEK